MPRAWRFPWKRRADVEGAGGSGVTVRLAVPVAEGRLCSHFGHCESFALVDVDAGTMRTLKRLDVTHLRTSLVFCRAGWESRECRW